jgi:hypothetical protein
MTVIMNDDRSNQLYDNSSAEIRIIVAVIRIPLKVQSTPTSLAAIFKFSVLPHRNLMTLDVSTKCFEILYSFIF